ncbi:unnamed protein product [Litomosoides sigmodontis]|uniref:CRIB domain-containing protein n=1 Tax=Litomosoides sigmodontis TaxID=42156 RepID=A0A3P6SXU4_LITSI|nr:unnamed protein product [Litomosoides sigmodontis]
MNVKIQADENNKCVFESENMHIAGNDATWNSQCRSKKLLRKTGKVKPKEVSTPTHFEHLVHIEDIESNVNNFVVTELSHDPIIKTIFDAIERNIANTDRSAIAVATTPADSVVELCAEGIKQNQEGSHENVARCSCATETYDSLNNLTVPSCMTDEKQSLAERSNLKLSLKCGRKVWDNEKGQSKSANYGERDNERSRKSFVILPKRHAKLTSISSSDSGETTSPVTPFTPTSVSFRYSDLRRQKAAYDALVSLGTESQHANQEDIAANPVATATNSYETKLDSLKDKMEIQEALKHPSESFRAANAEKSVRATFEEKTEFTTSNSNKKSVKQLAEMLDSKKLQFSVPNALPKLHPTATSTSDVSETNTEAKASSDTPDPEMSKPSLIGVNILGLNDGKSIAEIIAAKRNPSFHKRPPTSPKPFLKQPLATVVNEQRENTIVREEKKLILQGMKSPRMLSTIIKVDESECSTNFQSSSPASATTGDIEKDSSDQCSPGTQRLAANHLYENLNQNSNEKYMETSFDGPIARTVISGSKSGATKNFVYICDNDNVNHQAQQQQHSTSTDKRKFSIDEISTATPLSSRGDDACGGIKWRNDSTKRANFDISLENGRNSQPIPPQRTCFKRNSYGYASDKGMTQRSTSVYHSLSNKELNDTTVKCDFGAAQKHPSITNQSSSLSSTATETLSMRPKPARRKIDCMKRTTITVDTPETENGNFQRKPKRPIPIPRQSKLKVALNEDLLKKRSFAATKIQHSIVTDPESVITIAKAMGGIDEGGSNGNEWMLRL